MKVVTLPLFNGSIQFVFSLQFRRKFKYLKLGLCGKRKRRRIATELQDRISQEFFVTWRWFPFFDYLIIRDGQKYFNMFSNDPWPLKCFIEYEFWKYKNEIFDPNTFITYMCSKYNKTTDEVIEGCTAVMLNVYEQDKDFVKNANDGGQ